jgi:Na+-translocating ferredoxin:NAD+ oxidoreductase RnfC subunit
MSLIKKRTSSNKTATNNNMTFSIALTEDESVQFNPNKAFNHITTAQVLKIIQKADIEATKENSKGYVNFKLSSDSKTFGFVNFYANDLDNESSDESKTVVVMNLEKDLSNVKLDNISMPLTSDEADTLIDNL